MKGEGEQNITEWGQGREPENRSNELDVRFSPKGLGICLIVDKTGLKEIVTYFIVKCSVLEVINDFENYAQNTFKRPMQLERLSHYPLYLS